MTSREEPGTVISLLCRVRDRLCSLPLQYVVETMRPLPIASLSGLPAFVRGMSVVRGVALPVVDAGVILGSDDPPRPSRFVTLRTGENQVALSVEEVLGVRELTLASFRNLPPLLSEAAGEVIDAIGTLDTSLLFALQTARIVPESVWQAIRTVGINDVVS